MGDVAYIPAPVNCDFCQMAGKEVQASYDGATIHGPWAYMCEKDFIANGVGLGTGRGQFLIVGERPPPVPKASKSKEDYSVGIDDDPETEPKTETKQPEDDAPVKIEWPNP